MGSLAEQLDQELLARWGEIAPRQQDTILAWLDSVSKEGAVRMLKILGVTQEQEDNLNKFSSGSHELQQRYLLFVNLAADLLDQVNKLKMVSMGRMSLAARHKMNMIDEDVKVAC